MLRSIVCKCTHVYLCVYVSHLRLYLYLFSAMRCKIHGCEGIYVHLCALYLCLICAYVCLCTCIWIRLHVKNTYECVCFGAGLGLGPLVGWFVRLTAQSSGRCRFALSGGPSPPGWWECRIQFCSKTVLGLVEVVSRYYDANTHAFKCSTALIHSVSQSVTFTQSITFSLNHPGAVE